MRWTAIDELTTGLACWLQIAEHIYNPSSVRSLLLPVSCRRRRIVGDWRRTVFVLIVGKSRVADLPLRCVHTICKAINCSTPAFSGRQLTYYEPILRYSCRGKCWTNYYIALTPCTFMKIIICIVQAVGHCKVSALGRQSRRR